MQVRDNVIGQDRGSVIVRKDIRQTWYLDSQMREGYGGLIQICKVATNFENLSQLMKISWYMLSLCAIGTNLRGTGVPGRRDSRHDSGSIGHTNVKKYHWKVNIGTLCQC